jgi:hypothetical protein
MSLEARYRTEIVVPRAQLVQREGNFLETPCGDLLRRALDKVARDHHGQLARSYADTEGRTRPVLLALRTVECPLGLGVDVDADGRVVFRYDARGNDVASAQRLCEAITQTYAVLAIMRAQARHGFQVSVEERPAAAATKQVVVRGVRV